jgi:predicted dienelactone hydrolase
VVIRLPAFALVAVLMVSAPCHAQYAAGYEAITIEDGTRPIRLDIWYPTNQKEAVVRYGISVGSAAVGATPAGEGRPVVLLSHGSMGAANNYSWVAEPLARRGYVVLGVSHFGESPVFRPQPADPAAVSRYRDRTHDFNVALDYLLQRSRLASHLDPQRIGAVGHSAGGATVLMLAGTKFSFERLSTYCGSGAAAIDKGCWYKRPDASATSSQSPEPSSKKIRAVVVLDPAVGPGFDEASIANLEADLLIVGSTANDFLPYDAHAGRIARAKANAQTNPLAGGEGHFVYLDTCSLQIEVMGVPLCKDRAGVDRDAVHGKLVEVIVAFLSRTLANNSLERSRDR